MIKLTELYSQYMYPKSDDIKDENEKEDVSSNTSDSEIDSNELNDIDTVFDGLFNDDKEMFHCFHADLVEDKYVITKEKLAVNMYGDKDVVYTIDEFKALEERIKQRFATLKTFAKYDQWEGYQGIQFNLKHNEEVYNYLKTLDNIHVQDYILFDLIQMVQHIDNSYKNEAILYYMNIEASKLPLNVIYRAILFDEYDQVKKYQEDIFTICYEWNISPTKVIDYIHGNNGNVIFRIQKWLVDSLIKKPKFDEFPNVKFDSFQVVNNVVNNVCEEHIIPTFKKVKVPKTLPVLPSPPILPSITPPIPSSIPTDFKCEPINMTLEEIKNIDPIPITELELGYFDSNTLPTSFKMNPVNLTIDEIKNIKPKFFQPSF